MLAEFLALRNVDAAAVKPCLEDQKTAASAKMYLSSLFAGYLRRDRSVPGLKLDCLSATKS